MQHVFLIGAKSLGAYGGYETFINKLTEYHQNKKHIKYHIACKANGDGCMDPYHTEGAEIINDDNFVYHNAHCFRITIPERLGPAQAIYYDCKALERCVEIIKEEKIDHAIVYIMACRIGTFIKKYYNQIHDLGGQVFINPDGHEWMRAKWSLPIRKYWKYSERMMIKWSDLVVCDSINIEKYIHNCYDGKGINGRNPRTVFIAYGAETRESNCSEEKIGAWLEKNKIVKDEYFLVVGRFVPENNYETMIREFMNSKTKKDFVIITNINDKFLNELERKLKYKKDTRIKFVGTVYDQELLMKIREYAFAYFHGHEVGGTNPSLLEALGSTKLNLLLDVGFNREVAEDSALYWTKENGNLAYLIDSCQRVDREKYGEKAKKRIKNAYSWQLIADRYEEIWTK